MCAPDVLALTESKSRTRLRSVATALRHRGCGVKVARGSARINDEQADPARKKNVSCIYGGITMIDVEKVETRCRKALLGGGGMHRPIQL